MWETVVQIWPVLTAVLAVALATLVSLHVVVKKKDSRSAIAWMGLIWLVPLLGSFLYLVFGINRIETRAARLRSRVRRLERPLQHEGLDADQVASLLPPGREHLIEMARYMEAQRADPLLAGNLVTPLVDGDEAYPAMLAAIEGTARTLTLSTYIFNRDRVGREFIDALVAAKERGVEVRVLVDDLGSRYSWPSAVSVLTRAGVPAARFLPAFLSRRLISFNLRNHRKILVADGRLAYTGGINFDERSKIGLETRAPARDLHFRIEGPSVASLQAIYAHDWRFATGEVLEGDGYFPAQSAAGEALLRCIADGPDEPWDVLRWTILGALACARHRVVVVTPYFLPDHAMSVALGTTALRGVEVDVVVPGTSDQRIVSWAMENQFVHVLRRGVRMWRSPPPFDHSKLMLVDGVWAFFGSANWDTRSMRLNFELNLECYNEPLVARLEALARARIESASRITIAEVEARSLPVKIRDGVASLFSPVL